MKKVLGILQVAFLSSSVVMCATVTYAAIDMATGQYRVEIAVNNQGLTIKSIIDKRECRIEEQPNQALPCKASQQQPLN
ncbi:hypothetical protein [Nostoc sp. MS1]|uniref:hypothetical protein n=1 Tax=Nostoc sp. MS1 TaxID=2764711 RepID=UPI001CC7EF3F|nr:hypothetical protein [Nostoc sp. MS1]BCL37127.1 hypothetical protein NSMS1_35740 [Nostoc sp. MS1]